VSPPAAESGTAARPGPSRGRAWAKVAIKSTLGALVVIAAARHASRTWGDLRARGESVRVAAGPFAAAVGLYLAGLVPFGVFYHRVMRAGPSPIGPYAAIRAYLVSHLGKYVPGKALVVVMRVGLSTPYGARAATSALASLYETLVMMAAGGLIAAVAFGPGSTLSIPVPMSAGRSVAVPMPLVGLGLGGAFLVVVAPGVFPRLAGLVRLPFPGVGPDALPATSARLLAEGLALAVVGWTLLGLSQVAVFAGLYPGGLSVAAWPATVASVALATVVGFVVPVAPGGLGVREWVLWTALGATIDPDYAVVAALVLRLAWVVGEVAAAAVLFAIRPLPRPVAP